MSKLVLAGIGIDVAVALGVAAVTSLDVSERDPQHAQTISTTLIKESIKTPRQECRNITVTHREPVQDENRTADPVLDTVVDDVIEYQFGDGRGEDIATMADVLDGGHVGNQIQGSMQENDTYTAT